MGKGQVPAHAFTGKGIGLKFKETPVAVRFPKHLKAVLDAMGSSPKQDFIRAAVVEKLARESKLPLPEIAIASTPQSAAEPTPKKSRGRKKSES